MRISEITYILNSLEIKEHRLITEELPHVSKISNIIKLKEIADAVSVTGLFSRQLSELNDLGLNSFQTDSIRVDSTTRNIWNDTESAFITALAYTRESLNAVDGPRAPNTVQVLLPKNHDIKSIANDMVQVAKCLEPHVIHPNVNGVIQIERWETGSLWIEIIVGCQAAVNVVGGIAWAAAVVLKKYRESQILEQAVRGLSIKNDSVEDIAAALKGAMGQLIEEHANAIASEHLKDDDPEVIKTLHYSIEKLWELMERGTEIHPSLNAPENVQNLFPTRKALPHNSTPDLLESKVENTEAENDPDTETSP